MKRHASMNRIYRLVWSRTANSFVAVAENATGRGKSGSGRKLIAAALALTVSAFMLPEAMAGPTGGQVTSGAGSIAQTGSTTNIKQTSQNLSLNWATFNVAPTETVNFVQPNTTSIAVNRILDTNGTQILGHLNANGQVYLINPNGILFGQGAQINVGGLVASTLDINDASLSNATRTFSGNGAGSVINRGTLTAASGGYVALIGNHVSNQGLITAQLGSVVLGAGNAVTLTFAGNNLVHLQVDQSVLNSLAENGGLIRADGGQVIMTAGARNSLLASVVNNTGIIEARTANNQNGTITLLGGMVAGTVNVGGTLDASGQAQPTPALPYQGGSVVAPPLTRGGGEGFDGGFIETSAARVNVSDTAHVTTLASPSVKGVGKNGTWLIDPVDFTIAASGGNMTGAAVGSALAGGSFTVLSSAGTTGTAGNINVNDTVSWSANTLTLNAFNNININAAMNGGAAGKLALLYGQRAAAAGNTSNYFVHAPVSLAAGQNFSTKLGSNGAVVTYTVITALGAQGDAATVPAAMTLQGMAATTSLAGHYVLGANIDATTTNTWGAAGCTVATCTGFTPIGFGNLSTSFTGTFDGLGHTIGNLTINQPTNSDVGLFGSAGTGSAIRNVGLVGGSVSGGNFTGGLAGVNAGTISNAYATISVTGAGGTYTGGLVGYNTGTISNAYATGSVTGGAGSVDAGGLVGGNIGTVSNAYATGSVSGTNSIGGLAGYNTGTISNAYATGSVTGSAGGFYTGGFYVGGLVGLNSSGTISNTYATGSVTGGANGLYIGGVVGYNFYGLLSNSFYDSTITALPGVGGGAGGTLLTGATGMTTAQMKTQPNFTSATAANGYTAPATPGWDFTTPVWAIAPLVNSGYPYLRNIFAQAAGNATALTVNATVPVPGTSPLTVVTVIAQLDSQLTPFNENGQSGLLVGLSTTIGGESTPYLRDATTFLGKQSRASTGKAVFLQIVGCGAK